ncbi:MAG: tRNA (adenosine(37)-N6)-threonylcarbamoyltransferase complex transferase subunit TsaD [Deltaproteobacteria bacterium]|jgi:N6-L-threonylcarbamoyladenine synthase|nr:tRNA (adenosine(37)-N6)-threonylcarbamoyltransferase complex transferase subunit TsaD [Deltaproteobacteria bacterium]
MKILGIETSCDETAAAVVEDGKYILSNIISSQIDVHSIYGGVVPEIASRHHLNSLLPVIEQAIAPVGGIEGIDAVAVTNGPGLIGSLLVGVQGAKTLSWISGKKLVAVNHLEAHLKAPFIGWKNNPPPEYQLPQLSLLVSGGHTILYYVQKEKVEILGATRDDAAGEAFDKVAKMTGLGYPGGPVIEKYSKKGNPEAFRLPRALHKKGGYDFSFSGLKTAVMNLIENLGVEAADSIHDIAASFQMAAVDSLLEKVQLALENHEVELLVVAGGVAANSLLRGKVIELAEKYGVAAVLPPKILCTDNAAMVAAKGYELAKDKNFSSYDLNAFSSSFFTKRGGLLNKKGR